jgi:hypothetical protein
MRFFVHKKTISAVRRLEFVSDRMKYIILRSCWCDIIVLNGHTPCQHKSDDVKDSFYEELGCIFDQFPRYDTKILLGEFNVKIRREDIFKPTVRNESSHKISNNNAVIAVNFATSKNLIFKSTMLTHRGIHKYTSTSPDGNTHKQIDHI